MFYLLKRPSSCKLSPINDGFDDTQQWKTINLFKKECWWKKWGMWLFKESPLLYKNEEIYSVNHNSLYFQSIGTNRDFTDKYVNFIKDERRKVFSESF